MLASLAVLVYIKDNVTFYLKIFFCLRYRGMLGECSEDEDSFYYSIRDSTTKVDDLGVEFLSSDEEN
jgi:hypothetical protein